MKDLKRKDFLDHYQIGCWYYRTTSYRLKIDPVEVQKDLGFTYAHLPQHWHYGKTGYEEKMLDDCMQSARKLEFPVLYYDRRLLCTKPFGKPSLEKGKERLLDVKEKYGDVVQAVLLSDEPFWGYMDGHKSIDTCVDYIKMTRDVASDFIPFIALYGAPYMRWEDDLKVINDYVDSVKPDFLFYNVYSQLLSEQNEREQGDINFFYQLNVYTEIAKQRKLPLWASLMCSSCWSFREPNQIDLRWQLNVCAAHGVKGFVWYHLQNYVSNAANRGMCPLDAFDRKSPMYYWMQHEDEAFMENIAKKLDDYELQEVYHFYQRFANFKSFEYSKDEIIEDCTSEYNRPLILSRFKAKDGSGKQRIMVTNVSRTDNGHCCLKFRGEYAKYNVSGTSMYLAPAGAIIIDLFDTPIDPAFEVLD